MKLGGKEMSNFELIKLLEKQKKKKIEKPLKLGSALPVHDHVRCRTLANDLEVRPEAHHETHL